MGATEPEAVLERAVTGVMARKLLLSDMVARERSLSVELEVVLSSLNRSGGEPRGAVRLLVRH